MSTTIAISETIRDQLKEMGNKGESYDVIISKLLSCAKEKQLHDLLMDESNTIPIQTALLNAKKRWQK